MKRKKIAILGALIAVVSMVILLLPLNALFAVPSTVNGSLAIGEYSCIPEGGEDAAVTITMSGSTGAPPAAVGIKWRLDVDGSEVWRTPIMVWQTTTPVDYNANLGLGLHTARFYIATLYLGPWPADNWAWNQVDYKEFTIEECEEPEPERETGDITVVKRDPGGTLLAGAGFTIYYSGSGTQALPEGFTDDSGMITFAGLAFDTYIVRETTAPAGFGLAPDQTAVLNVDNLAATVNFVNEPVTTGGGGTTTTTTVVAPPVVEVLGITEELPFTGQSMWLYIIGAAMLALAGSLTFVLRAVKSKE